MSKKMPIESSRLSRQAEIRSISSVTASEVSRLLRNPYWLGKSELCLARKSFNLLLTNFSRIFEVDGRIEIGR